VHTSAWTFVVFWAGVVITLASQVIPLCRPVIARVGPKLIPVGSWALKLAPVAGIVGTLFLAAAAWMADTDWSRLPLSSAGLHQGQLWNDGGIPAIAGHPTPNRQRTAG
jgi:hypothetical protein